jgi:hypothetical protein
MTVYLDASTAVSSAIVETECMRAIDRFRVVEAVVLVYEHVRVNEDEAGDATCRGGDRSDLC